MSTPKLSLYSLEELYFEETSTKALFTSESIGKVKVLKLILSVLLEMMGLKTGFRQTV